MMPSPTLSETPPRLRMKSGKVNCMATSDGLGYAAVWQKDCITKSAEKPRQAKSFSSSRVIGPVVSWEPTVVMAGSQNCPGRTPSTPQALPTIFCARVYPFTESAPGGGAGTRKMLDAGISKSLRALDVMLRPMMSGIRPQARTSSRRTSVFSPNVNHTAHVELGDIHLERECTCVLHGVVEDRSDLVTNADSTSFLVWQVRDVITHVPEHRVGCRLTR